MWPLRRCMLTYLAQYFRCPLSSAYLEVFSGLCCGCRGRQGRVQRYLACGPHPRALQHNEGVNEGYRDALHTNNTDHQDKLVIKLANNPQDESCC